MVLIDHRIENGFIDTMCLCRLEYYKRDDQEVRQGSVVFYTIDDEVDFYWPVHILICVVSEIQDTFKDPKNRPNNESNNLNGQLSCVQITRVTSRLNQLYKFAESNRHHYVGRKSNNCHDTITHSHYNYRWRVSDINYPDKALRDVDEKNKEDTNPTQNYIVALTVHLI